MDQNNQNRNSKIQLKSQNSQISSPTPQNNTQNNPKKSQFNIRKSKKQGKQANQSTIDSNKNNNPNNSSINNNNYQNSQRYSDNINYDFDSQFGSVNQSPRRQKLLENNIPKYKSYNYKSDYDDMPKETNNQLADCTFEDLTQKLEQENSKISHLTMTKYSELSSFLPRSSIQYLPDLGDDKRKHLPFVSQRNIQKLNQEFVNNGLENSDAQKKQQQTQKQSSQIIKTEESIDSSKDVYAKNNGNKNQMYNYNTDRTPTTSQHSKNNKSLNVQQFFNDNSPLYQTKNIIVNNNYNTKSSVGGNSFLLSNYSYGSQNNLQSHQKSQFLLNATKQKNHSTFESNSHHMKSSQNNNNNQSISSSNMLLSPIKQQQQKRKQFNKNKSSLKKNGDDNQFSTQFLDHQSFSKNSYSRHDLLNFQLQHNKYQQIQYESHDFKKQQKQMHQAIKKLTQQQHYMDHMKNIRQYAKIHHFESQMEKQKNDEKFHDYLKQYESEKREQYQRCSLDEFMVMKLKSKNNKSKVHFPSELGPEPEQSNNVSQPGSPTKKISKKQQLLQQAAQTQKKNVQRSVNNMLSQQNYRVHWYRQKQDTTEEIKKDNKNGWRPPVRDSSALCIVKDNAFLYGGIGVQSKDAVNKVNAFNIHTKGWREVNWKGDLPRCGKIGHTMHAYRNSLVIFGGQENTIGEHKIKEFTNDIKLLDLETNQLHQLYVNSIALEGRKNHVSCIVGKHLIVQGGENTRGTLLNDMWAFEIGPNKWQEVQQIYQNTSILKTNNVNYQAPQNCPYQNGVQQHSCAYVLHPERRGNPMLYYDTFSHKIKGNLNEEHKNERIKEEIKHEGVYFYGGIDKNLNVYSQLFFLQVDTKPVQWKQLTTKGKSPGGRYQHAMEFCQMLNILVVFGGKSGGDYDNFMSDVFIFKLGSLEWIRAEVHGQIQEPRAGHMSFIHETKLFILGGQNDQGLLSNEFIQLELDQRLVDKLEEIEDEARKREEEQLMKKLQMVHNKINLNVSNRNIYNKAKNDIPLRASNKAMVKQQLDEEEAENDKNSRKINKSLDFNHFHSFVPTNHIQFPTLQFKSQEFQQKQKESFQQKLDTQNSIDNSNDIYNSQDDEFLAKYPNFRSSTRKNTYNNTKNLQQKFYSQVS